MQICFLGLLLGVRSWLVLFKLYLTGRAHYPMQILPGAIFNPFYRRPVSTIFIAAPAGWCMNCASTTIYNTI